ncbi:hypothetical protein ACTFIU_011013 [Dictyostelium citrinum]
MDFNEILFWKVFHNKFIFNIIIDQISNHQLEYERIELYKIGNRIKFKEIQSLKFMVSKKQFELLKCKLKHNDFILYNRESIDHLIRHAPIQIIKLFIENHKIKQQDPQLDKLNVMIDLVFHSIKNNNLDCLRYFIFELQLPVERTVFEYTLKEKSIEFIDLILNSNQFKLEESTRRFCLKLISNNAKNFNDIIEYVIYKKPELNYFTSKPVVEKFNQQQQQQQQQQKKYFSYINTPQILDFFLFYKIKSKETKLKLLEMGCVSTVKPEFIYSNKLKPNNWKDYDEVEFYIFIILKLCELEKCIAKDTTLAIIRNEFDSIKDCTILKPQDKCKKLHELVIIKLFPYFSSHIYRDYFDLYDQVIPNTDYFFTFQITFSTFSINGLNYLLNLAKKKQPISTTDSIYINEITKEIDSNNEKSVLEFLRIYFKSKHLLPQLNRVSIDNMFFHLLNHCSIETLNEILKLKSSSSPPQDDIIHGFLKGFFPDNIFESSREKADQFIKTIYKNKDNDRFMWFSEKLVKKLSTSSIVYRNFIYNYKCLNYLNISTKNHIDFLIENKPDPVIIPLSKKYFQIETLELIDYFEKRLNLSKPSQFHYYYLYLKSLFNGDFKTFQAINDIDNLEMELTSADFISIEINHQLINQVIENINKSNLKSLASDSKIKLLKFLLEDEKFQPKVIESLQFNLFPLESMLILLDYILDIKIEVSNAIINNLVMNGEFELSLLVIAINQFEKSKSFTIYKSFEGKQTKNGHNAKEKLIPFIKSLFNKLEANINDDFPSLSDCQEIQFIFSYLYKILIQCDDITLELINGVRQFYLENGLMIIDDLFNLSCYLGLRSNQFIKYLSAMKIRLNNGIFFLNGVWNYEFDCSVDQKFSLDFNLMLKEVQVVTIDKDFFDVIYQTTKSKDHNFDFFKKIVFHKLRNLMIELHKPRPLPIAIEVNLFIELNRADMVLELAEIEISQNKPFPVETISSFLSITTLDQLKQLLSLIGINETKRNKYVLLKNSIIHHRFEFIDYLMKESNLFIEEYTKGSLESEFKIFKDILISNDIQLVEYLLKNYRGQDFETTTTSQPVTIRSIDLFKDFLYSQNLYLNNFQVTMDNGLIDLYDLLSRHFPFVPKKDNIFHTIRQGRFKLIEYFYRNNYLEHLGEETITAINDFVMEQYPNNYFTLKK